MGAKDASGKGLQYATENMHQNKFPRKLWRINPGFWAQSGPKLNLLYPPKQTSTYKSAILAVY